jgi:hypothetical protein
LIWKRRKSEKRNRDKEERIKKRGWGKKQEKEAQNV